MTAKGRKWFLFGRFRVEFLAVQSEMCRSRPIALAVYCQFRDGVRNYEGHVSFVHSQILIIRCSLDSLPDDSGCACHFQ